ncbi:hypothetical protein J0S82_015370 [Galemys pyrenaicus]|uniref:TGF-beta family profile domain-containing protein n=1 Tax=Galemys pyrenaicus TaxID=202257 RepID=A0A8J6DPR8_GALPY|nr:hypothetical protein J0S82_015370 [Galemys pyrenaicus]
MSSFPSGNVALRSSPKVSSGSTVPCLEGAQFLHGYWLLNFEAAPFSGVSFIQLWAWVPVAPYATELVLEFEEPRRGPRRYLLGSFPIIFPSYQLEKGSLLEIYCLLRYWMELVPTLLEEEESLSTAVADAKLRECVSSEDKRDLVLLLVSPLLAQLHLLHLPYVQKPFTPGVEQLFLGPPGQRYQQDDPGQAEKLCHLQNQKVNLHRAAWGECIVAPKSFNFPLCQGTCLTLNSEYQETNFQCRKREAPTCSRIFQVCGPIKVRLFSLMVQDDEHKMSVHHMNTSLIEKCGCF